MLRSQLGFDGLAVADASLLASRWGHRVGAADLVSAGVDLVLRPVNVDAELRALIDAMEKGTLDRERVHEAAHRRRLRAEMAGVPVPAPNAASDDHAWLDELGERTISVIRGRSVRIADPVEVAVVGARSGQALAATAGLATGVGEAGGDASGVRRVHAPSAVVRTPFVVVVVPPAGVSTCEQEVAALCAEARRLGRESVVVWCAHPAMSFAGDSASLTIACWSPAVGSSR